MALNDLADSFCHSQENVGMKGLKPVLHQSDGWLGRLTPKWPTVCWMGR